jgi:N6-L-threonylcarbamoyladenine synthase
MNILAIETSCDESAISILASNGDFPSNNFTVLGNVLQSQAEMHREYGGVYPSLAKREHAKNLPILLREVLTQAGKNGLEKISHKPNENTTGIIRDILSREPDMGEALLDFLQSNGKPNIDYIAVTSGPGLEPALWVGIKFAEALGKAWNISVIPVNHMEGHFISAILEKSADDTFSMRKIDLPALALLISGGHTQLVLMNSWLNYEILGETLDDAVGEAFDKVARMLGLSYPGGPEISKLASAAREKNISANEKLPRPMINSNDCNFSFSGLKTSVLYRVRNLDLSESDRLEISREFEDAVSDVLTAKSLRAIKQSGVKTFVIGGGVSANTHIRESLEEDLERAHPNIAVRTPPAELTGDNAIMIAVAAYLRVCNEERTPGQIVADGNLSL